MQCNFCKAHMTSSGVEAHHQSPFSDPADASDTVSERWHCAVCGNRIVSTVVANIEFYLGLMASNRAITGIKIHRALSGADLRAAKAFIDGLKFYRKRPATICDRIGGCLIAAGISLQCKCTEHPDDRDIPF